MGKLDGKVALVTGAGQGIGKGIALRLAGEGADIVLNDIKVPTVEATAAEVTALGRKALAIKADVTKKAEVDKMMATAVDTFKKIDILVNNAGVVRHAEFLDMTEEDWDVVLDVNLKGVFLCCQAGARQMIPKKYGKIINMASIIGLHAGDTYVANYAPSKAGVISLTKVVAKALGQYGINVNAIAPGVILTEILLYNRTQEEVEAYKARRRAVAALGEVGTVEDIANLALFLASDESSFITGQVIACDGGRKDKL